MDNPFSEADADRRELWEMVVKRDFDAFIAQDWSLVHDDFLEDVFFAIDGRGQDNPDRWKITFPTLGHYRESWLAEARALVPRVEAQKLRQALFDAVTMTDIEIEGDVAVLHKKFDGAVHTDDGEQVVLKWQTLYQCRKIGGQWKIVGFVGYLPYPMGSPSAAKEA
jgi:hypothetical protein